MIWILVKLTIPIQDMNEGYSVRQAIEGDFVETIDSLIFDVKGFLHPPDRTIVYLRYVADPSGERQRQGQSARAYCSFAFRVYIWWGRVGERIRSGRPCLRAAIAMMYETMTHSVTWMVAFSKPLVCSWFRP